MVINHGSLIISLDFELYWGIRDKKTKETYGSHILGAKEAIPKMVKLFENYGVHSTFAIVGFLFCGSKKEIIRYSPLLKPNYSNKNLSPYEKDYFEKIENDADPFHTARELVNLLKNSSNIEIGTHTFSHYYCLEEGQTIEEFESDLESADRIATDNGIQIKSIVFPRNQVSADYLEVCENKGINRYRGNPRQFFGQKNGFKNRMKRFADSYIPLGVETVYDYSDIKEGNLYNVKASRFLRPYSSKLAFLEKLKVQRITNEMTLAAKEHKVYHLWWHPHNFGLNQDKNLQMLDQILNHYAVLSARYDYKSYTMSELSDLLNT